MEKNCNRYIKIEYAVIIIYHKTVDFTLKKCNFSMKMVGTFFSNFRTYTNSVRTKTNGVPVAIVATISKV